MLNKAWLNHYSKEGPESKALFRGLSEKASLGACP
ncbi:hypothetical protein SGRA_2904 [Saprospira grandis str. Lewin]|uniref:Uncharacterized protein n=1 Tax=Saprospira grandis (strain Lewin) TaxID=984262 RepID=H6LAN9_SAPGL|nr:hypothetical protein SGRA_2904 [Saprospira grandis str. Lewin]